MKKQLIFASAMVLGCLFANTAKSQLYINANAGYGFGPGEHGFAYNSASTSSNYHDESVKLTFGKGLNVGAAVGFMFSENVGAELGISYLMGGKTEAQDVREIASGLTETTTNVMSASMIRFMPTLVVKSSREGMAPYAKFGLVIGSGKFTDVEKHTDGKDVFEMETEYSGGMALGFTGAFGLNFGLSDNMDFFGELNYIGLSYAPTDGEVTKATFNGVDELGDLDVRDKKVVYSDSYDTDRTVAPSPDEPSKSTKFSAPFSSFGLNFGIRLKF